MILSGLGTGTSGMMAQAKLTMRGNGTDRANSDPEAASSLSGLKAGSLSTPAENGPHPARATPAAANMMADFFVTSTSETSKYVQATLDGLDLAAQMREKLKANSFTLLDAAGGPAWERPPTVAEKEGDKYTEAVKKKFEVERLARNEKERETIKASERNLEETREDIDEAAEEVTTERTTDQASRAAASGEDDNSGKNRGAVDAAPSASDAASQETEAKEHVVTAEETLLNAPEGESGDTVVEAVERFQETSAQEEAAVNAAYVAAGQGAFGLGVQGPGSRVDMLV